MECGRGVANMRSSSCWPITAKMWVRRASPSGTPTRGTAPAGSPLPRGSEEPPAMLDRGLALPMSWAGGWGVGAPGPLRSSVTKRFGGSPSTTAQDNGFRRSAVFPGGDGQLAAVRGHDLDRALDDEGPVGLGGDSGGVHDPTITAASS